MSDAREYTEAGLENQKLDREARERGEYIDWHSPYRYGDPYGRRNRTTTEMFREESRTQAQDRMNNYRSQREQQNVRRETLAGSSDLITDSGTHANTPISKMNASVRQNGKDAIDRVLKFQKDKVIK